LGDDAIHPSSFALQAITVSEKAATLDEDPHLVPTFTGGATPGSLSQIKGEGDFIVPGLRSLDALRQSFQHEKAFHQNKK
jgi:hypothetical protein